DGAQTNAHRALERLCWSLLRRTFWFDVGRHGRARSPATARGYLRQCDVDGALRQFLPEATLIEFGNQRALEFVALVDEGEPESKTDIVEDFRVLGPDDYRARAHHRRNIAVHESVAGQVGDAHHLGDDVAAFRCAVMLGFGEHDFHF